MWPNILQLAIIFAIAIAFHEFAHAYISYKLGDPTPKIQKRLTLNPASHIDPLGFILIFLIGFGWGKPVQINPIYYKNKKLDELKVALAGPITNIMLATLAIFVILIIGKISGNGANGIFMRDTNVPVVLFLIKFSFINIVLAVFNMVPLPPLDGFSIIKVISPSFSTKILIYQKYVAIGFLLLIFFGPLKNIFGTVSLKVFTFLSTILGSLFY